MAALLRSDEARLFRLCQLGAPQPQTEIQPLINLNLPVLLSGGIVMSVSEQVKLNTICYVLQLFNQTYF